MSLSAPPAVLRLLPDEPLARLAADGSDAAFHVLYSRHAAGLTASCRRILGDDEDARDALQNTMVKAWAALGRRGDAPLRPWLYRIAHNESVSMLRQRRPRAELSESAPSAIDVHEAAAQRAELAATITGIGELTTRQRQALLMRAVGDASYDDIAARLNTSHGAARQSVRSARRALRRRRVAGILPLPAWIAELCAATSTSSTVLTGQTAGRAAAVVTAAALTVGGVHQAAHTTRERPRAQVRHERAAGRASGAEAGAATVASVPVPRPAIAPRDRVTGRPKPSPAPTRPADDRVDRPPSAGIRDRTPPGEPALLDEEESRYAGGPPIPPLDGGPERVPGEDPGPWADEPPRPWQQARPPGRPSPPGVGGDVNVPYSAAADAAPGEAPPAEEVPIEHEPFTRTSVPQLSRR